MSDDRPWYLLSSRDHDRIFATDITDHLLSGVRVPSQRRLITVHGPAGSGKTVAQQRALERMGPDGAVIADVDSLLGFHPHYAELQARNDRTASGLIDPDTVGWVQLAIALARDRGLSLIREGGPAPGRLAEELGSLGYHTELDVQAVQPAISRLSVLSRYQQLRARLGVGRTVEAHTHDRIREMMPKLLTANEHRGFFHETRLWRRGADEPWYHDLRDGPGAADAYRRAEELPLTPAEAEWFVRRFAELDATLPDDLRGQLDEIAELARPLGVDVRTGEDRARVLKFTQDAPRSQPAAGGRAPDPAPRIHGDRTSAPRHGIAPTLD